MRKYLLTFLAGCFYYCGLVKFARWLTQRSRPRLVILNYHRASGGNLRRHLLYLQRHYRLLHLEAALQELYTQDLTLSDDPRTPLVLTFDDGYQDTYTHALALARELLIPLTIFLIPGYVESGEHFWWLEAKRLTNLTRVPEVTIEERRYRLDQSEERKALIKAIDTHLRYAPDVRARESFLTSMYKTLEINKATPAEDRSRLPLNWDQVREMHASGWISFGAHTMHHPILSHLSDPAELQYEIRECRTALEQQLGHPVLTFAYPVGQLEHIGDETLRAVQDAGYKWAVTTRYGTNTPATTPFLLHRIEADVTQHWLVVAAEAAGLWGFIARLRHLPAIRSYLRFGKV